MADREPTRIHPENAAPKATSDARPRGGSLLAEISNAMVRIHKEHWGKGPTKARTSYADDLVVTRLDEIFTRAEATLIAAGRVDEVRSMRAAFHDELESEFVDAVERLTGRRVRAFLSEIHAPTRMGVELFVLEPADEPRDPASELSRIGSSPDSGDR